MLFFVKNNRLLLLVSISYLSLFAMQFVWLGKAYRLERKELVASVEKAFDEAYQKEQTYRIPVFDIVNSGSVTIESCGNEEVYIVRKCPQPDTIIYNNKSGHSINRFINRVFVDLREQIVPMNISCMADLFSGLLHEADIAAVFVIERFNEEGGELLETSLLPDRKMPDLTISEIFYFPVSEKETIRGIVQLDAGVVLKRLSGTLYLTFTLNLLIFVCVALLYRMQSSKTQSENIELSPVVDQIQPFQIGRYSFNPAKNELSGFDEVIQLNKKENAILYSLCSRQGNVVERNILLQENWGNNGLIYSRSLDTYLATLRKYLKKDESVQIVTVKGVGYKLVY